MPKFRQIDRTLDKTELVCAKTDGTKYKFNRFTFPLKFILKIHNYEITLNEAVNDQVELETLISNLNRNYNPWSSQTKIEEKKKFKQSQKKIEEKKKVETKEEELKEESEEESEEELKEESRTESQEELKEESKEERAKKFIKYIEKESKDINHDLFKKDFNFLVPSALVKKLY